MRKLSMLEVSNILKKYPKSVITKYRKNNYHKFEWAIEIPADTEDPFDTKSVYLIRSDVAKKLLALDK